MTTVIDPTADFLEANYNKTLALCDEYIKDKERCKAVKGMIEHFGERYATAPASSRKDYHLACVGGLAYHNLHVFSWIQKLAFLFCPEKYSNETLLIIVLLHDMAKTGNLTEDFYLPQESEWHRKNQGKEFEINKNMLYFTIPQRSLYLASHFGIKLSEEEYLAVLLSDGHFDLGNAAYKNKEPDLAYVLHFADCWASRQEKYFNII